MALHKILEELLKVPTFLKPYLDLIYTNEDIEIINCIKNEVLSKKEIGERLGKKVDKYVDNAYKTAVLNKVLDGENVKYKVNPLTIRINNLSTFHRDKWESIPLEDRKEIAAWHFERFLNKKKNTTLEKMLENNNEVLPLKDAIKYIQSIKEEIYVIPCDCKSITENCDFDRNVCINFKHGINTPIDRGYGKSLTIEETVELLEHAEKEGLVHSGEKYAICNCCNCCYPRRASKEMGLKGKWPIVNYVVSMDKEKCVGCGLCVKRCQFDVFTKEGKKISIDESKCWGCGLCVSTCPTESLKLNKIM